MDNESVSTVIDCSDNGKNAALFFDKVIFYSREHAIKHYLGKIPIDKMKSILPEFIATSNRYYDYCKYLSQIGKKSVELDRIHTKLIDYQGQIIENRIKKLADNNESMTQDKIDNDTELQKDIREMIKLKKEMSDEKLGITFLKKGVLDNSYSVIYPFHQNKTYNTSYDCTLISLVKIPIIDTSKCEWEQVIKIREDKDSIKKLRNLKLFFHENYSGKEMSYIGDDLSKRLEDYKNTAKDWGFETLTSSMTLLSTSVTTVGSTLALALTGQSLEVAAVSGIFVGISNVSLHLAKEKKKLSELQKNHPLAYIIDTKKKLE